MADNTKITSTTSRPPRHGPGSGHGMHGEKAKNFKGTLGKLLRRIGEYPVQSIFVLILSVAGTVCFVYGPQVLGEAFDLLTQGITAKSSGSGDIDLGKIGYTLGFLLVLYGASGLAHLCEGLIATQISQNISYKFRTQISQKIGRLPMRYFESQPIGDILSRITNDVDTLSQSLQQCFTQFIFSVTSLIGVAVMMFKTSWKMTLIALLLIPISAGLIGLIMSLSQKHFKRQQKYLGEINGQVEETFAGQTVVKLFGYEDTAMETFKKTNEKLFTSAWKSQFLSGLMMPIMQFVGNLGYVGVVVYGAVLAASGELTVGSIVSFINYIRNFTQPIQQLAQVGNQFQSMAAAAERVFEFLEEEEESPDAVVDPTAVPTRFSGTNDFQHVHFGYLPEKTIINDFCCNVQPGQTVAIVGPTGAGKTTIVKLLMRFYDVDSGAILIDNHDIRTLPRHTLREGFGMVLQDTWLFSGTILENIRYGRLDATDEEVIAAAKAAHADHFIKTLSEGYNTHLAEDAGNLSQGQRQLLTIARSILADRPILILDEATSSVDTRTEERIQRAMRNLMRGRTSFVIAHRLSTIRDADLILVLRDGDIVEQGTHTGLLAQEGFYANLYNSQFSYN
ncbi:MAG: ABC transporter ATP-binding protein/permease [Oscillospiraceae bacterium]|jgi:ATP-binding cassette subfamily B protein|nr:ABC transporter ATP-binding protein/permease [Oscillospiraceae bacterium]